MKKVRVLSLILVNCLLPTFAFASHALEAFSVFAYLFYFAVCSIIALINFVICKINARKKNKASRIITILLLIPQAFLSVLCFEGLPLLATFLFLFILFQLYYIYKSSDDVV